MVQPGTGKQAQLPEPQAAIDLVEIDAQMVAAAGDCFRRFEHLLQALRRRDLIGGSGGQAIPAAVELRPPVIAGTIEMGLHELGPAAEDENLVIERKPRFRTDEGSTSNVRRAAP